MRPPRLMRFVLIFAIASSLIWGSGMVQRAVNAAEPVERSVLFHGIISFACPGAIYEFDTTGLNRPLVALTIDDGPDRSGEHRTAGILKALKDNQATATFFLIAENFDVDGEGTDPIVQQILAEGHELGNHLTRDEASILLGDRFVDELNVADEKQRPYLENLISPWVRPGVGFCTAAMQQGIVRAPQPTVRALVRQPAVLGSVWPLDTFPVSSGFVQNFIRKHIRPGSVIVLHDGGDRGARTAEVLANILPELQKDYEVVSLSEMLAAGAVPILSDEPAGPLVEFFRDWLRYGFPRLQALRKAPLFGTGILGVSLTAVLYGLTAKVMLLIGFSRDDDLFLRWESTNRTPIRRIFVFLRILIVPAFIEELVMRGLLLPGVVELSGAALANLAALTPMLLAQTLLSTAIYISYHPLLFAPLIDAANGLLRPIFSRFQNSQAQAELTRRWSWAVTRTFWNSAFLVCVSLLGVSCALSYLLTNTLLYPVLFHGFVVFIWLEFLGGEARLRP
ncbi:MAG: polysaccharide deacetylase family protein [Cyanobacteria bacterium P01_H01_bin.15]